MAIIILTDALITFEWPADGEVPKITAVHRDTFEASPDIWACMENVTNDHSMY